jgi:ElaB/YqjD/DUF883 family membrane-anchored ribosome-binding protein
MNTAEPNRFNTARDHLATDMRAVVEDAEELLRATRDQVGEKASTARVHLEERLAQARDKIIELERTAAEKAKRAAKTTDQLVHDHPWQAIGIAASVAFLLGMLTRRH